MRALSLSLLSPALAAALLALAWLPGCGPKLDAETVATVNGAPVTIREVDERYARLEREMAPTSFEHRKGEASLKRAILQELINRRLLLAAAGERKFRATPEEAEAEAKRLLASLSGDEQAEVFTGARMTSERFRQAVAEEIVLRKLGDSLATVEAIPEAELAAAYDKEKGRFFQEESVRARQIVVGSEADTRVVKRRLALGEDFAAVARELSQSPDAKKGGDLGFFQRGQMPPELEKWAFQLNPGQTSPVIETPYGFHILKIEERKPARQLELSEVREEVAAAIRSRKREERYRELLLGLRKEARIVYNRRYASLKPEKKK